MLILTIPFQKHALELLITGELDAELKLAMQYVEENVGLDPKGSTASIRDKATIKELMLDPAGTVLVSGTLSQLCLATNAVNSIDPGRDPSPS